MAKQWRVLFRGRVQGVGFRATTAHVASGLPVTGWVKNLPDGRVELVAEGDEDDLQRLLNEVLDRTDGFVRDYQVDRSSASGQYRDFSIAY